MGWVTIDKTWHDTTVDYCDVCGNLLIHRAWSFETPDGRSLRACREDDERLFALLARYAPTIDEVRATWLAGQTSDRPSAREPGR